MPSCHEPVSRNFWDDGLLIRSGWYFLYAPGKGVENGSEAYLQHSFNPVVMGLMAVEIHASAP